MSSCRAWLWPEAAADQHGEAVRAVRARHGHEAEVVAVDVDAVVARPGQPDLELPGQVGLAVERLAPRRRPGSARDGLLAVDPDLVVRAGSGAGSGRPGAGRGPGAPSAGCRPRGAGQATTLRTTSPHAASVVTRCWSRVRISGRRLALADEVELDAPREVSRTAPSATVVGQWSMARHWSARQRRRRGRWPGPCRMWSGSWPERVSSRRTSRSSCWYIPWNLSRWVLSSEKAGASSCQLVGQRTPQTPAGGLHILDRRHKGERSRKPDLINQILGD